MKAIAYSRCAAREVPEPSHSLNHQQAAIKDYCQRNNIDLVGTFYDNGASGLNFERVGWKDMETFLSERSNGVDAVVVADIARIGRDGAASLMKIAFLKKRYGIEVIPVSENRLEYLNSFLSGK